jgi:hypothetical protein
VILALYRHYKKLLLLSGCLMPAFMVLAQVRPTLNLPQRKTQLLLTDPDRQYLFTCTGPYLYKWDLRTGRCLLQQALPAIPEQIKSSPNRRYLLLLWKKKPSRCRVDVYELSSLEKKDGLDIDSFFNDTYLYPSAEVSNFQLDEITGWLGITTWEKVLMHNIHTKETKQYRIEGVRNFSAIAPVGKTWWLTGADQGKQKTGLWELNPETTSSLVQKILFQKEFSIHELITDASAKRLLMFSDTKQVDEISIADGKMNNISNKDGFFWNYVQYFFDAVTNSFCFSNEYGCWFLLENGKEINKLVRSGERFNYFVVPFDAAGQYYLNKSSEETVSLFTIDSVCFGKNDCAYFRKPVVLYGSPGMVNFSSINGGRPGKFLMQDINNKAELNLDKLTLVPLKQKWFPEFSPTNSPLVYLPGRKCYAELWYSYPQEDKIKYSLGLYGNNGLSDTIIDIITLPADINKPQIFAHPFADTIYLVHPMANKIFISVLDGKKPVEISLPQNVAMYWPPFDYRFCYLPNGHFIYTADLILDVNPQGKTCKLIDSTNFSNSRVMCFDSADSSVIYKTDPVSVKGSRVMKYNFTTGDTLTLIQGYDASETKLIRSLRWKKQQTWLLVKSGGWVEIWDRRLSEKLYRFAPVNNIGVNDVYIDNERDRLIFLMNDFSMRLLDIASLKPLPVVYFQKQGANYSAMAIDSNFNYFLPAGQTGMVNWVYRNKAYDFMAFDKYFNQPARVLNSIRSADTAWLRILQKSTDTRLKRSKRELEEKSITELPTVSLDLKKIPLATDRAFVELPVQVKAGKLSVVRWQVYTDGLPTLYNAVAELKKPLPPGKDSAFIWRLDLPANKRTQVAVRFFDEKDNPSLAAETNVYRYRGESRLSPRVWYLGYGVSNYKDSSYNLRYAAKDVTDIASLFKKNIDSYHKGSPVAFTDSLVVWKNIFRGLAWLAENAAVEDVVLISISGHGITAKDGSFYFMLYDADFSQPEKTGLPFGALFEMLKVIPCRNKLVLLDACESGDYDEEGFITRQKPGEQIIVDTNGRRGIDLGNTQASTPAFNYLDVMKQYFVDLEAESGATIIAASSGTSAALENDKWQNGVFSYAFMEGLFNFKADYNRNKNITVSELVDYMAETVTRLTNGFQQPSIRNIDLRNDWIIIEK